MAILLGNDDGVDAPGLKALAEALEGLDDLYIAAPSQNRSGVGNGITVDRPVTARRHSAWPGVKERTSVDGTPADAIKYGLQYLLGGTPPRLVVTGINHGPNIGRNIRCSGTLGAAYEAFMYGFPALAVSVDHGEPPLWDASRHYARLVAEKTLILARERRELILNLNVPRLPLASVKGLRFARHGHGGYQDVLVATGHDQYSIGGEWRNLPGEEDSDSMALAEGYAVLTPLTYELTDQPLLARLQVEWSDIAH
ncbi:MAG: 5'/3'-nucleotidase SurE [Planctomycetota bacterium]|jgi:5'-nucleotidase|nr:5'/3'-nucleotidase SurE [Planctomycetota bacterium]